LLLNRSLLTRVDPTDRRHACGMRWSGSRTLLLSNRSLLTRVGLFYSPNRSLLTDSSRSLLLLHRSLLLLNRSLLTNFLTFFWHRTFGRDVAV
jgi:hypothetical protein